MPGSGTGLPKVLLVTVVDDLNAHLLAQQVDSIRRQTHDKWSLLIIDGRTIPRDPRPSSDGRIDWVVSSDRVTIASIRAGGELVGLLGRDCWLEPHALAGMVCAAQADPGTSIFTCDGDVVDHRGVPLEDLIRPQWSPRRLRAQHYCDGLVVIRGGDLRGAIQHLAADETWGELDLLLRLIERGAQGDHVRQQLFHRVSLNRAPLPAQEHSVIVQAHLDRLGLLGSARPTRLPGVVDVRLVPKPGILASVVIPSRGSSGPSGVLAVEAVRSVMRHDYIVDVEFVVVHDSDADRKYIADLRDQAGSALTVVDIAGPFNFSAKVNAGVAAARGSVLVLLNDDTEVLTPGWLDHMVALAAEPDIGAVGAKLLYPDGTVQHAGHCYFGSEIRHVLAGRPDEPGPAGEHAMDREVVGVTAACMAVRRDVWEDVGGMDESLPNNFNDVDLCWRLRERGYRIVQSNAVQLIHFESKTREPAVEAWEVDRIRKRLGRQLLHDPYTSPLVALVNPGRRSVREWVRVSGAVMREEGASSFARKARGRLTGR